LVLCQLTLTRNLRQVLRARLELFVSGISAPDAKLSAMWIDGGMIPTACDYE